MLTQGKCGVNRRACLARLGQGLALGAAGRTGGAAEPAGAVGGFSGAAVGLTGAADGLTGAADGLFSPAAGPAIPPLALAGPAPLRLAAGVWWWPGAAGEAQAANRGRVSALLAVRQDAQRWCLGSGPSPAWGRAWRGELQQRLGGVPTAVISPWARPELVLGVAGLGPVQHWAHADVARAMAAQCAGCEDRLRQRLGPAAADLGPAPAARAPSHRLHGEQGRLGPWDWWRAWRSEASCVLVWRLRQGPWWSAPGLLWGDGPPDLRDADLRILQASLAWLARRVAVDGPQAVLLPEQGPPMLQSGLAASQAYLRGLAAAVLARQAQGGLETDAAGHWPGLAADWAGHARHALNWQRAWRQLEDEGLRASPEAAGT